MTKQRKKKKKSEFCVPVPVSNTINSYRLMWRKSGFDRCVLPIEVKLQKIKTTGTGYVMYLNQN